MLHTRNQAPKELNISGLLEAFVLSQLGLSAGSRKVVWKFTSPFEHVLAAWEGCNVTNSSNSLI